MDANKKKTCQYGAKCYRKNQTHLKEYFHPKEIQASQEGDKLKHKDEELPKNKDPNKTNPKRKEFDKSKQSDSKLEKKRKLSKNVTTKVKKDKNDGTTEKVIEENESKSNPSEDSDDSESDVKSESWTYIKIPKVPAEDVKDSSTEGTIKSYYLVDMPPDFYSFFKFCQSVNKNEPLNALKPFGLNLVGPFEIIAGKDINLTDKNMMLCHWRYFYDPPEFQTVLASDSGFHLGYWRDDPKDQPQLVASNNSKDCSFQIEGGNIFGAVYHYLTDFINITTPFIKITASKFQHNLGNWAEENKHELEKLTQNVKKRQKKINSKTFHGLGIVVPVQKKTDVGYRPLIETDANLKRICKLIMNSENETVQEKLMDQLQPLITFANIANDECDFGNGLELGIDLFCMGSPVFHNTIEHLLTNAYNLLKRSEFGTIIKTHLKNRKKGTNVSVI